MENAIKTSNRIHPLVAAAAVALILVSLVGVAAITGLLPTSNSTNSPQQQMAMNQQAQAGQMQQAQPQQLASSAPISNQAAQRNEPAPAQVCNSCGEVAGVRTVTSHPKTSGVGIVGGAVVGGLLGNQVGGGTGRTLATVAGAVGGGYAGNKIEENTRTTTSYVVEVRMDNGKIRSFPQTADNWRAGDKVRVVNGRLESRG
ncbi:glycine zipper 2TM domain-containing protein [Herbaspirillum lusitanum]|jgi:outer membrane lipoprotein SlyB|uniref:Glycine zipper 2TM domain-containing protein n=1 Tax=Herbaspirillum lusitanum TaxID=213312 RepID=A0ABW9AAH7_9BURK